MTLFADRAFTLGTENAFKIGPEIERIESAGKKIIRLNLGEPDLPCPDFLKEELKRQIDNNNTHYCDPKGLLSLRTAIAEDVGKKRNFFVSPEQVVVFPGAKPAIGFSQQMYCNPGDEIIYPSPGFPIYESFIPYVGAKAVPIYLKEEQQFKIDTKTLAESIHPRTKLIFINYPSNPTGSILNKKDCEAIAETLLKKHHPDLRIYLDEIYENLIFDEQPFYSLASIPELRKYCIISSGFSKTFAWTGGRVGFAVFPSIEEADMFKNLNINYFSCVPPYNQEAARVALQHPETPKLIAKTVAIFEQRRNRVLELLPKIKGIHFNKPEGAFYIFPNIEKPLENLGVMDAFARLSDSEKQNTSPTTLFQKFALHHHGVSILDRRSFGKIGSLPYHYIRLSIASEISQLEQGIELLHQAFLDTSGFKDFMQNVYGKEK